MSLDKTEEYDFRLLLLRLSTNSLIHMLLCEADDRQADIIFQEIIARGGN